MVKGRALDTPEPYKPRIEIKKCSVSRCGAMAESPFVDQTLRAGARLAFSQFGEVLRTINVQRNAGQTVQHHYLTAGGAGSGQVRQEAVVAEAAGYQAAGPAQDRVGAAAIAGGN